MSRGRLVLSIALAFASVAGTSAAVLSPQAAYAAEKKTVSAKLAPSLGEAQKLMQSRKYADALKKLQEADAVQGKTPYEEYIIAEMRGACNQQLGKYTEAAKAYETTLASGQLSGDALVKRQVLLAQLYMNANNTPKAIELGNKVLASNPNNLDMQVLVGQSYYQKNDYANAAKLIGGAVSSAERSGRKPDENWIQILMSCYFKQGNMAAYTPTVEKMVRYYPKPNYWNDLGRGLLNSNGITDTQSLDVRRLMMDVGAAKDARDYTEFAETALLKNAAGEAKTALEAGYKANILGKGATADREKRLLDTATAKSAAAVAALPAADTAAQGQPTGKADVAVGEVYLGNGDYQKAVTAFERGLGKGGVDDVDGTKLHLAQAYAKLNQKAKAISLLKGITTKGLNADIARVWLIHLQ